MKGKILPNITKILAILIICLISFVGIYVQKLNSMENVVKDYKKSKELEGYRQVILEISDATQVLSSEGKVIGNTDDFDESSITKNNYTKTETLVNKDESKTIDNYEKSKNIIEKRLSAFGVQDYNLSLDSETGRIYISLPEDDNTDTVISNLTQVGNFVIKDSETGVEYIKNEDLKKVSSVYNTTTDGTTVALQIELNKVGKEILKNLSSGDYATIKETENKEENNATENSDSNSVEAEASVTDKNNTIEADANNTENSDATSTEENSETKQKKIVLAIDTNEMITTSFDEPMVDGVLQLTMGKASKDSKTVSDTLSSTSRMAVLLNEGTMPLTYKVSNNMYIQQSNDQSNVLLYTIIVLAIISLILVIYLIVKYKAQGLWATLGHVGFLALYLLLIRYTNVEVSIVSLFAIFISLLLNFEINRELLKDEENANKKYMSFIMKVIPIYIISIIFSFTKLTVLNTFGMAMFWGITLSVIYNLTITRILIKTK